MTSTLLIPKTVSPCAICESSHHEKVGISRTALVPFLKTPIVICRDCGFVYVNPRWNPEQYQAVMDLWYPAKFAGDPPEDPDENKRFVKWKKMDERISSYFPAGIRTLLDIGAGQGWCIEYLKRKSPNLQAFAVERWDDCRRHMETQLGTRMIGKDIEGDWDIQYHNQMDLIVFRHTLEHLLSPKAALEQIRSFLSDQGLAYIVVPSMREVTRNLMHDYFRPTHLSYFCTETLESLALQAGLEPVVLKEKGEHEVWGLFRKGTPSRVIPKLFPEMKERIQRLKTKEMFLSRVKKLKIQVAQAMQFLGF